MVFCQLESLTKRTIDFANPTAKMNKSMEI